MHLWLNTHESVDEAYKSNPEFVPYWVPYKSVKSARAVPRAPILSGQWEISLLHLYVTEGFERDHSQPLFKLSVVGGLPYGTGCILEELEEKQGPPFRRTDRPLSSVLIQSDKGRQWTRWQKISFHEQTDWRRERGNKPAAETHSSSTSEFKCLIEGVGD